MANLVVAKRVATVALALMVVATACTPGDEASEPVAGETTTAATTTTSTSSTTTTTLPDPAEAHVLSGQWLWTYTLEEIPDDFGWFQDVGDIDVRIVDHTPRCEVGPCEVDVSFDTPYDLERTGAPHVMQPKGGDYVMDPEQGTGMGTCAASNGEYFEKAFDRTIEITITPTDFESDDSVWFVTEVTGERRIIFEPTEEAAAAGGCDTVVLRYRVEGVPLAIAPTDPIGDPPPPGLPTYARVSGNDQGIFVQQADGSEVRLTETPALPEWSPDGTQLAYQYLGDIYVMASSGGEARLVLGGGRARGSDLAWSPDGTRIAFVRDGKGGTRDVWILNTAGWVPESVTDGGAALGGVAWSADGEWLYFDWGTNSDGASKELSSGIVRLRLDGDEATMILDNAFRPSVSSDGSRITVLSPVLGNASVRDWEIFTADSDGSRVEKVAEISAFGNCGDRQTQEFKIPCAARWSADGERLAYASASAFVLELGSGDETEISSNAAAVVWTPGGGS